MTIGEIIQRVQSLYSRGVQSDDSRLTPRHIYNKLLTVRSFLISQEAKKRQKINQWNYQTIPCVELIKAPIYECPCLPPLGCETYRTRYQLPKPLTNLNNHLIQSVTSLDGNIIFSEVTWEEKKYKGSSKFTASKPDYFIRNKYLYITAKISTLSKLVAESKSPIVVPKIIAITGLFEDPIEAIEYEGLCTVEEDCTDMMSKEFPIDYDMIDTMIDMAVKELVILFSQIPEDKSNNGIDTNLNQSR